MNSSTSSPSPPKNVCKLTCIVLINCFYPGYEFETNLHPVQIYFDTRKFMAITKDEKATFLNQKAVIGEFTGLFLGLSFIFFVEIFYFLILGLVRTLGDRVVKRQPVNEEDEQNENDHQEHVNVSKVSSSYIISLNNFQIWFNFPLTLSSVIVYCF